MSNMDILQQAKSKKVSGGKKRWSLEMVLYLIKLINNEYSHKEIGELMGKSEYSIRHQVGKLEKVNSIEELYKKHGVKFVSGDEVNERIQRYEDELGQVEQTG